MARRTEYCFFSDLENGGWKRKLLCCTSRKARVELGRTYDNIKCTRSIWKDEEGNEYIRHSRFTEPLTLEYLSAHGTVTRL